MSHYLISILGLKELIKIKRTISSIILFFLVFGFVLFSHKYLMNFCDNITVYCDDIQSTTNMITPETKDDPLWDVAFAKSTELENYMKSKYGVISLYLNHELLDSLQKESINLTQFLKAQDLSQSLSALSNIQTEVDVLISLEKVNWQNIL